MIGIKNPARAGCPNHEYPTFNLSYSVFLSVSKLVFPLTSLCLDLGGEGRAANLEKRSHSCATNPRTAQPSPYPLSPYLATSVLDTHVQHHLFQTIVDKPAITILRHIPHQQPAHYDHSPCKSCHEYRHLHLHADFPFPRTLVATGFRIATKTIRVRDTTVTPAGRARPLLLEIPFCAVKGESLC